MGPEQLVGIGYWAGDSDPGWPDVHDWVDEGWDPAQRKAVREWLGSGRPVLHSFGFSLCRFCRRHNGSDERSDGVYIWPQGLDHYVSEHGVRLPRAVVEHALSVRGGPASPLPAEGGFPRVDRTWWAARVPDWVDGEGSASAGSGP